jgi:Tfp pilus assembly protein PilV
MTRTIFFLAMTAASTAFAAGGQVYKWTDAQGVVHYSDAPPPTTQTNVQTVRVTGGDRPHDVVGASATGTAEGQAPPAQDQMAQNTPAAPVDHSKDCANARSNLELLQSKFQVTVNGADGKPVQLDDKARQVQLAAANAQVAVYCK